LVVAAAQPTFVVLAPAGTKPCYVPPNNQVAAGLIGLDRLAGVPGRRPRRRVIGRGRAVKDPALE
jgi:hypothetical protein